MILVGQYNRFTEVSMISGSYDKIITSIYCIKYNTIRDGRMATTRITQWATRKSNRWIQVLVRVCGVRPQEISPKPQRTVEQSEGVT